MEETAEKANLGEGMLQRKLNRGSLENTLIELYSLVLPTFDLGKGSATR